MSSQSVVLTGATGSLGAVILEQLLANGNPVTAVLRSFKKGKSYFEKKYAKEATAGTLRFAEIPDMAVPNAFHAVAKGASAIIHVATPLANDDFLEKIIKPVELITENVLNAATASGTVKRVIITGTILSSFDISSLFDTSATFSEADYNSISQEAAISGGVQTSYAYSKTTSERQAWKYMSDAARPFDLVFLLPPHIYGRSIQPAYKATKDELGGISAVYRELFDRDTLGFMFPYIMDIGDVAKTHIQALDASVPGNERYLTYSHTVSANMVANAIRAKYPALRTRVPVPTGDDSVPPVAKFDKTKADKVFGTAWKGWEESVYDIVDDILKYEEASGVPGQK